ASRVEEEAREIEPPAWSTLAHLHVHGIIARHLHRVMTPGVTVANLPRPLSDPYFGKSLNPGALGTGRARWRRSLVRAIWLGCSLGALVYSMLVITHVREMGTIGVRCMFGTKVEEEIHPDYAWSEARPRKGDELLAIGDDTISEGTYAGYADY